MLELSEYYEQKVEMNELSFPQKEPLLDSLLQQKNIKIDSLRLIKIYRSFLTDLRYSNIEKSLSIIKKIEEIANLTNNYDVEDLKAVHRNKIAFFFKMQQYEKSIREANLYLEKYPENDIQLGKVYRQLSKIYDELGDLKKSIDNLDKSIYIYSKLEDNKGLAASLRFKLGIYVDLEDSVYSSDVKQLIRQIEELKKVFSFDPKNEIAYKNNVGVFFDFLEDYPKAKANYLEALELSLDNEKYGEVFFIYANLGIIFKKEGDIEKALQYLQKASEYINDDKSNEAMFFNNLADIHQIKNNHEEALIHYQKAITSALEIEELNYQTLPKFQDVKLSPNKSDVLGYLIDKANGWIAYYDAEENEQYLQYALETFTLADQLIDIIYRESREDLSKLFWREKGAKFYPKAVEVCYLLEQPEKAFFFMEKNKAMLLLDNITNATAKRLSKLPENVLIRERNLIKKIKVLESEIQGYAATESQKIDDLKNRVFSYKNEYNAFIDSLETNYPKYYDYKKNINIVQLEEVQKNLQKDELILQYIVGAEKGFVTLICPKKIRLKQLPKTALLAETVAAYKNAVSKPFVNAEDKNVYEKVATQLYQQLIPFEESASFSQKRITIIADGMLQYIPFEALRTPTNNYLIENAQVQYNYSLSSAAKSQQNSISIAKNFIALAPTKFKDDQYSTLATSAEELEKLSSIFNAQHFQCKEATKGRFTEAYGNYKIIHLSTHGGIDKTIPWMAFYDEKMTLDELYFTKNQSDLVVLSACKTSDGELKKGEGVMSLARGFFNAGAKSVISSLWDINEKASNEIIQEFYKNILAGDTKSAALQKAKLTYIKNNGNTSEASPYYWSALTLTGDVSPIELHNNSLAYYVLGGFLLVGMVLTIRSKRNQEQAA